MSVEYKYVNSLNVPSRSGWSRVINLNRLKHPSSSHLTSLFVNAVLQAKIVLLLKPVRFHMAFNSLNEVALSNSLTIELVI